MPPALRAFLKNGGAAPDHVFEDTATHEAVDFRTVRDSGITLRFLAGERAEVVQREAGHRHVTTTLGNAKEVANKGGRYGDAFLTSPAELVGDDAKRASATTITPPTAPIADAQNSGGASGQALCAASCEVGVNCEVSAALSFRKMVARVGFEPTTFGL